MYQIYFYLTILYVIFCKQIFIVIIVKCIKEIHQAVVEGDKKTVQNLLLSKSFDSFYLFHCELKVI